MNNINIAVIEDNPADLKRLCDSLDKYMQSTLQQYTITSYTSGESFLNSADHFHLVFMDIELPGINGLETARELRNLREDEVLVFVTNMVQYAIHGYSVKAIDYIVKPVMYDQLALKMPGFLSMIRRKQKTLMIRQKHELTRINIPQIRFIEVFRHLVVIQLEDKVLECHGTLKEFEDDLSGCGFYKCSQSCLVNMNYVQSFSGDKILVDGHELQVSRREKKNFLDAFTRYEKEW